MSDAFQQLLQGNQQWVEQMNQQHPELFDQMAKGQKPDFLWIGCSDSRVPPNQATGLLPGSIFVQRNIANQVLHTDMSLLSVVFYAVKALGVKHIVVCGHYGCGGVAAAMDNKPIGMIDQWLLHIKDVYRLHKAELDGIADRDARFKRFVELNVHAQVDNMCSIPFLQEEWQNGGGPTVHGCVFDLASGKIKDLQISRKGVDHLDSMYQFMQPA